ncbi:MAG: hypothetical protein ACREIS_14775 [Nitrospiraceae bacterium]
MLHDEIRLPLTGTERDEGVAHYRLLATTDYVVSEQEILASNLEVLKMLRDGALQRLVALVEDQIDSKPGIFRHEEIGGSPRPCTRRFAWGFYRLDRKSGIATKTARWDDYGAAVPR